MKNFLINVSEGLRRVRKVWIVTAVVVAGLIVGAIGFGSGTIQKAIAARQNKNDIAAVNVSALATATQLPVSGADSTPTAVPEVAAPTADPAVSQPVTANDLDALTVQMQTMMDSLNGMMEQLDQKGANLTPLTVAPASVDLQPFLVELQTIEQEMGPLMVRIQADLQGNPAPEELASVRAQLEQIQVRMANLMNQLQAARNGTAPVAAAPTEAAMPGGMSSSSPSMDNMMQTMDDMMDSMNGMSNIDSVMMDDMMQKMDNIMMMMDGMMGMGAMSDPMNGTTTTDPAMMDDMMQMMDDMMNMMDDMMPMDMGMPDM